MTVKPMIALFLACSFSIVSFSQLSKSAPKKKTTVAPKPKPKPKAEPPIIGDNSLLFEISGKGLTQPSWLFGTMHVLCAVDANLSTGLKKVIGQSSEIFFEVNMSDMTQMMGALKFIRMSDGKKITDLLTPVEYDRVKSYFDKHPSPIPFSMMNNFKPYFLSAAISADLLECKEKSGVEQVIMAQAQKEGKKIDGLETIEFQASLFDSIPYEKQAKDLVTYVDSIDNYKKVMTDLVDQYKLQHVPGLDSLMQKSDPGMTDYLDLILYQRNHRWKDQIIEQIFQHPVLFAVGAGHLGGEKGLLNLLRQEGFTVKAIRN